MRKKRVSAVMHELNIHIDRITMILGKYDLNLNSQIEFADYEKLKKYYEKDLILKKASTRKVAILQEFEKQRNLSEKTEYSEDLNFYLFEDIVITLLFNFFKNSNFNDIITTIKFDQKIIDQIFINKPKLQDYLFDIILEIENLKDIKLQILGCEFWDERFTSRFIFKNKHYRRLFFKRDNPIYATYKLCRLYNIYHKSADRKNKIDIEKRVENFRNGIIFDDSKNYSINTTKSIFTIAMPFRN